MDTLTTSLRLLANNIDCEDGVAIALVLQAAAEIERLREALEELRAAADQADEEYRAEIARLRLTDEEREAVAASMIGCVNERTHATLRALLERFK
jgi:hypothetical protein